MNGIWMCLVYAKNGYSIGKIMGNDDKLLILGHYSLFQINPYGRNNRKKYEELGKRH
jgi:hypothetical protein